MARYQVFLDSPLGERRGMLMLHEDGRNIIGTLSILDADNPVAGRRDGEVISLRHTLRTYVSALECSTELHLEGSTLHGIVHAGSILMKLRGTAIEEGVQQVTKKEHRNHGTSDPT